VLTGNGRAGPPAPYRMVDNEFSLLDVADLVFVDAPGTGFGRIVAVDRIKSREREKLKDKEKEFWGVDQDAQAFARFIKKFLARQGLWNAPKFLFGESYGTTRSAVLAQVLHEQEGVDVNGIMLLSQTLNYALSVDEPQYNPGADLPYALALPTFAATAWYHRKLPAWSDRSPQTLERLVAQTRRFALEEYLPALLAGGGLEPARRRAVAERLAGFIGLKPDYLEKADLRVNGGTFGNQLLADEGLTVGRLDTRYSGPSLDRLAKESAYDPQSSAISSAYVSAYNDYARRVLGFDADREYRLYAEVFKVWDFRHKPPGATEPIPGLVNVMPDLATLMRMQPRLKVATFMGYFDLATTFFAAEYELAQLPIPPALRANLELHLFPSGHMMYDDPPSLKALHGHIANFVRESSSGR
jgi:carboxypeptidase C (cathepsin A)